MKKNKMYLGLALIAIIGLSAFSVINPNPDKTEAIKSWFLAGSNPKSYEISTIADTERQGKVGCIKSVDKKIKGFGTLMQMVEPGIYKGKRVKLSASIKTTDVSDWCGMWFRVDGDNGNSLSFDNMQDRPIKNTTPWTKYEIVLDVPNNAIALAYGVLISSTGTAYIDNITFEIVGESQAVTGTPVSKQLPSAPLNTNFED